MSMSGSKYGVGWVYWQCCRGEKMVRGRLGDCAGNINIHEHVCICDCT